MDADGVVALRLVAAGPLQQRARAPGRRRRARRGGRAGRAAPASVAARARPGAAEASAAASARPAAGVLTVRCPLAERSGFAAYAAPAVACAVSGSASARATRAAVRRSTRLWNLISPTGHEPTPSPPATSYGRWNPLLRPYDVAGCPGWGQTGSAACSTRPVPVRVSQETRPDDRRTPVGAVADDVPVHLGPLGVTSSTEKPWLSKSRYLMCRLLAMIAPRPQRSSCAAGRR